MLTVFRQRCLLKPTEIARKLVIRELLAPEKEHSSAEAIKQDIVALLQDLANLPRTDLRPGLDGKIDPDFRAQVDVPPEPRTPGELKAEQAKAKRRRKAKTETMRKLRAKRP